MKVIFFLTIIIIVFSSCKQISPICEDTEYTYTKDIIDANCSTTAYHVQNVSFGDFTTYANMEKYLKNGKFNIHVFIKKDMPKGFDLRIEDKTILQSWKEKAYIE